MRDLYNINDWDNIPFLRLGEILLESGKINLLHLSMVLDVQKFNKAPMGELLLEMKVINDQDLKQALNLQKILQERNQNA